MDNKTSSNNTNGLSKNNNNHQISIRTPNPGEWGWIMSLHGKLYWDEYKFNENCELFSGEAVLDVMRHRNEPGFRAFIADVDGTPLGCVLCANDPDIPTRGRLRLLVVLPEGRGLGLGTRLVNACVEFARESGYKTLGLWTHHVLTDARRLYDKAGFKCVKTVKHSMFGMELDGHTLELEL